MLKPAVKRFFAAIDHGTVAQVRGMLQEYPYHKERDENGKTGLHRAAIGGYTAKIRLLLEHNADYNCQDAEENTPLHDAVSNGRFNAMLALAGAGADPEIRNAGGYKPHEWGKSSRDPARRKQVRECIERLEEYRKELAKDRARREVAQTRGYWEPLSSARRILMQPRNIKKSNGSKRTNGNGQN